MEQDLSSLFLSRLEALSSPDTKSYLLTVSGGIDSMVLLHLFYRAGLDCQVAHCNFQLRGQESDRDEELVRSAAGSRDIPIHVKHFDVASYMEEKGCSVQMAARELRYTWFEELASRLQLDAIVTAHNLNDSVETFFLNLSRGTGIRGLTGIPSKQGRILRPLLGVSRKQIQSFAGNEGLEYREDASNSDTKYQRNLVRHELIPALEDLNPDLLATMKGNMERLDQARLLLDAELMEIRKGIFRNKGADLLISQDALKAQQPLALWVHELFSGFGFTPAQCRDLEKQLERSKPGKRFISPTHQLYTDRMDWILSPQQGGEKTWERYYIDQPDRSSQLPFALDMELMDREELGKIPKSASSACLDLDKLDFPLIVRRWQHGDHFCPLGMDQLKKLSDFFVDEKVPVPEKQKIWILASGRKIVWVMGLRIDHRFRITDSTSRVLRLDLQTDILPETREKVL